MNVYRAILLLCLFLQAAPKAKAEPVQPEALDLQRMDVFRALLKHHGLMPINPRKGHLVPDQTVLVIVGEVPLGDAGAQLARLSREILRGGGMVLIATDESIDLTAYSPDGKLLAIDGRMVRDREPSTSYLGESDLPFLGFPNLQFGLDQDLLPILPLKRVATNRASFVVNARNDAAREAFGVFSDTANVPGSRPPQLTAMAIRTFEGGSLVVISDASIFSNQMLVPPANGQPCDNFAFANHLASFLAKGPFRSTQRTRCCYFQADGFRLDFDRVQLNAGPPEIRPSWAMIQKLIADNAEQKIDELQRRDFPTRDLTQPSWAKRIVPQIAGGLAGLAALLLLRAVLKSQNRFAPATDSAKVPANISSEPQAFDNLLAAARQRLRTQFELWNVPVGSKPRIAVRGGYLYRKRMEKRVQSLWQLAAGEVTEPVTPKRWRQLERDIATLSNALNTGDVTFTTAETPS